MNISLISIRSFLNIRFGNDIYRDYNWEDQNILITNVILLTDEK